MYISEPIPIAPKGRNKYGQYLSSGNVAAKAVSYIYNGNSSTGGNTGGEEPPMPVEEPNIIVTLEHSYHTFSRQEIAASGRTTDRVKIIGYRNNSLTPVYIMDCGNDKEIPDMEHIPATSTTYNITGVTTGISVSVSGNGTTDCYLDITITSAFTGEGGSLIIPANVSSDISVSGDTYGQWLLENETNSAKFGGSPSLISTNLNYSFDVASDQVATSGYYINLTNDSAGINCDADGNILSGAVRPSCTAELWYGTRQITTGVSFSITFNSGSNATGVTINQGTGVLTFNPGNSAVPFSFNGSQLEITVRCDYSGVILTKIMNVSKQYPGADGTGATTKWLVLSKDEILFNPNTSSLTPDNINVRVMKQVNDEQPVEDTETPFYYAWGLDVPTGITAHSALTNTNIPVIGGSEFLVAGLRNTNGVWYELESVPVITQGQNGDPGASGASGESVYLLQLTNQFDFVNVDKDGYVVTGQSSSLGTIAELYYGSDPLPVEGAVYSFVDDVYSGIITIDGTTGEVFFDEGFGVFFAGDTLEIPIQATLNSIRRGVISYKLIKNYPPENGVDATRYWLVLSATAAHIDKSTSAATPSAITASVNSQTGGNTPQTGVTGCTILYGYDTVIPAITYTTGIPVPSSSGYITVKLVKDNVQYDIQTIPIMKDGVDGYQGRAGAAIRGPYEWVPDGRRYSSGSLECVPGDGPYDEDLLFIDIIFRMSGNTKTYYRCVSSYTQVAESTWNDVKNYWAESDVAYDFVAANLLLAEDAKIKFLSGNEIYVMSGDTVCGGMRGANSGNTIVIWAGADDNNISNAKFKVDNDGSLTATTGSIGPWVISGNTGLEYNTYDGTENYRNSHLDTDEVNIWERTAGQTNEFVGGLDGIRYVANPARYDRPGLYVQGASVAFTEGGMSVPTGETAMYVTIPIKNISENPVLIEELEVSGNSITLGGGTMNVALANNPTTVKIVYMTSGNKATDYFSGKTVDGVVKHWFFNGDMDLGIMSDGTSNRRQYMVLCTAAMISQFGLPSSLLGCWCASKSNSHPSDYINTGIVGPNYQKKGDTIYITI